MSREVVGVPRVSPFTGYGGPYDPVFACGAVLLLTTGPMLAFPDVVSETWRSSAVTAATLAALALGTALLHDWKQLRPGLWLFVLALVFASTMIPAEDIVGLRHLSGAGLGVLAMAIVARWCTGSDRIVTAASAFALVSIGILLAGLVGAVSNITMAKFFPFYLLLTPEQLTVAADVGLRLPGLERGIRVNSNALGGTALLVLPMCAGLMAAALGAERRRRFILAIGCTATAVAAAVLVITLSRTAWAGAFLTLAFLGLRWRRGRLWVVLALVVVGAGLAPVAHYWRASDQRAFDSLLSVGISERAKVWQIAVDRLKESPWLGIGINAFHGTEPGSDGRRVLEVSHAHNIWLQTALDLGLLGLLGYIFVVGALLWGADQAARRSGEVSYIAAGAGLSLVAVHLFGMADAIALGAKVGIFQWLSAGLILAAMREPLSVGPEGPRTVTSDLTVGAARGA